MARRFLPFFKPRNRLDFIFMSKTAIYPGSFDPVTNGHVDLITRASTIFDKVIVSVAHNYHKKPIFTTPERVKMLREATKGIKGVTVESFEGLVIEYARKKKVNVLIRGLRMISDFEYEFQMALANKTMSQHIETFFMMTDSRYSFISSTLIKEIARLGGSVDNMVPAIISAKLKDKF